MSNKNDMKTPMGGAGLVRYDEDDSSKFKMTPKVVIAISVGMVLLEIVLFTMF